MSTQQDNALPNIAWQQQRQALLVDLSKQFTGQTWLQLSQQQTALLPKPRDKSLIVEILPPTPNQQTQRFTTLGESITQTLLCDSSHISTQQLSSLIQELDNLLAPGGTRVICGAGSLRGRRACGAHPNTFKLIQLIEATEQHERLKLTACYHHGSSPHTPKWKKACQLWIRQMQTVLMEHMPSYLQIYSHQANLRPGWVAVFKDQSHADNGAITTPIQRRNPMTLKPVAPSASSNLRTPSNR